MLAMGNLTRRLDADVHLLMLGGVDIARMELRSYQAEPLRRSLAVDGNVVRDYTFVMDEPRGAQVLGPYELYWTEEMPDHARRLAEAVVDWARAEENETGTLKPLTVNTPVGPVVVKLR